MISCEQSQQFIPLLHDGELDGPLRRDVRNHAISCTTCTRLMTMLDRSRELLRQTIEDEVDNFDFSDFWQGVESKLLVPQPDWREQLRARWDSWRSLWSWRAPEWATVAIVLLVGAVFLLTQQELPPSSLPEPPGHPVIALADNDQAQIESLSSSDTVSVWNEPTSNITVIWVSDEGDGGIR